jgi:SAM-dependent methyltransferase
MSKKSPQKSKFRVSFYFVGKLVVTLYFMSLENIEQFIAALVESLNSETFIKITLGNYRGTDEHLQKILIRLIETKRGSRLFVLYRFDTRDTAKNYDFSEAAEKIREFFHEGFGSGHLFTTTNDCQLEIGKKGKSRLNIGKPTFKTKPSVAHNREKETFVNPNAFYLKSLGITTDTGEIREKQQDKWKQINKFVETLANLFDSSLLKDQKEITITDMGCGKGYLTFAAYDYFKNARGLNVSIIGVDTKQQLVSLCNDLADSCEFTGLKFVNGTIETFQLPQTDILIALHACNTATDDAIFKGISANADLIVCSPCCHQEIRPQMKPPEAFSGILRHGILLEREAETITDGLRSLLLEKSGYATKVFEFIATEHTPKNNLIVGTKHNKEIDVTNIEKQIISVMDFYQIRNHKLRNLVETGV